MLLGYIAWYDLALNLGVIFFLVPGGWARD
jgi:hypothetical protein